MTTTLPTLLDQLDFMSDREKAERTWTTAQAKRG